VLHPDPRSWKTVLSRDGSVIWSGFVTSEEFASDPFEAGNTVSVTAKDGLWLLQDKPYQFAVDNDGRRTFLRILIDQLKAITDTPEVALLDRWYPYRESSPVTGEMLTKLAIDLRTWTEESSEGITTDRHEILSQIAIGFGLEIFQSRGIWFAVQPVELVESDETPTVYDDTASAVASVSSTTRDADGWNLVRAPRGGSTRHSTVASTYNFEPDPENLLQHSSFEPDDPSASTPTWDEVKEYWNFRAEPVVDDGSKTESELKDANMSIQERSKLMGQESESDVYAVGLEFSAGSNNTNDIYDRIALSRKVDFIGAGYPMWMRCHLGANFVSENSFNTVQTPGLEVLVNGGEWQLQGVITEPLPETNPGQEREIGFYLTSSFWPHLKNNSELDTGQEVIPEGAKIPIIQDGTRTTFGTYQDIAKTTRPFRVDDDTIFLEINSDIQSGDDYRAQIPIFQPEGTEEYRYPIQLDTDVSDGFTFETYLPHTDIRSVEYIISTRNPGTTPPSDANERFGFGVDNLEIAFLFEGKEIKEFTWSAQTGKEGRKMEHPPVKFGDGPQPISRGAITFPNGDTTLADDEIGWKRGEWGKAESPNGRTLTEMRSRERLRQRTSGTEEQEPTFLLREGNDWTPDSLLEFTAADGDELTLWRRNVQWNIRSGELKVPSFDLYQDDDSGIYTTLSSVQ
jgi:hypothetical protein